ncbi:hypothetical protein DVA85_25835 [Acinetobacter sp. RIT592]|nr:hypothetical protein DVA85_25835 [Acinetobacter sp. RIT592]
MFNKEILFVGTHEELNDWLNKRGYIIDEKHMNQRTAFYENIGILNQFGPCWLDKKTKIVCSGEGLGYPPDNVPTYSDKVMFELKTEGFTQKEINEAFYKAYKHLNRLRHQNKSDEIKDFIIEKRKISSLLTEAIADSER